MCNKTKTVEIPKEYLYEYDETDKNTRKYHLFSSRLSELVNASSKTNDDLAEIFDISRTTLWKFTEGYALPTTECLLKIANHFDVTTDYLLGISNVSDSYSGLSEASLEQLKKWSGDSHLINLNKTFNSLISNNESKHLHQDLIQLFSDLEKYELFREDKLKSWEQMSFIETDGVLSYGILSREEQLKHLKDKIRMQLFLATKDFCNVLEKSVIAELDEDIFSK